MKISQLKIASDFSLSQSRFTCIKNKVELISQYNIVNRYSKAKKVIFENLNDTIVILEWQADISTQYNTNYINVLNLTTQTSQIFQFSMVISDFSLLSQNQMVFINVPRMFLGFYNFRTQKFTSTIIKQVQGQTSAKMIVFQKSKYICIIQGQTPTSSVVSYYATETYESKQVPFITFKIQTINNNIRKLNCQSSLIAWIQKPQKSLIQFETLLINSGKKPERILHRYMLRLSEFPSQDMTFQIGQIKEDADSRYFYAILKVNRWLDHNKQTKINQLKLFIINKKTSQFITFQQTQFKLDIYEAFDRIRATDNEVLVLDTKKEKGNLIIFEPNTHKYAKITIKSEKGPTFYFELDKMSNYKTNHIQTIEGKWNITTTTILDLKTIYIHELLKLNEDFDDDLLHDAIDLLTQFQE